MLRALSLSPCDSFSPALLRSEPAALGAWIRYRFCKWLLTAPLQPSGWSYGGPDQESAGQPVLIGGASHGQVELWNGDLKMDLEYKFHGAGFEIGNTIPQTMMQSLPSIRGETMLWLNGMRGRSGQELDIGALVETRTTAVVNLNLLLDAQITRRGLGTAGAAMILGVRPELRADLGKLGMYTRKLTELAQSPLSRHARYTPGIIRSELQPIDRMIEGGVDLRAIQEEVEFIFSHHAFRAILFFTTLKGNTAEGEVSAYVGEVTNTSEDDKGALPKGPAALAAAKKALDQKLKPTSKKIVDFAFDEVGKSPSEIKKDLASQGRDILKDKLPVGNEKLKKVLDFGIDEIGKKGKEIKSDLLQQGKDLVKDKIPIGDGRVKKLVDFGIDEIGKSGKEIKGDLGSLAGDIGGDILKDHKDQLLAVKYPAIAAAAVALASSKQVRQLAVSEIKSNEGAIARTAFNELGEKVGIPKSANDFLAANADAIVKGDWQSIAKSAVTNEIGGGPFTNMAANVVLEKMTGKPVTTSAVQQLGAQGLKALFDNGGPIVASGKTDAAVTDVAANTVTVNDGVAAKTLSHSSFMSIFSTVASLGVV